MATALIVACKLINEDAIPALLPLVLKLLGHNEASIRKKAIMTIQRFYELNDSCITDTPEKVCVVGVVIFDFFYVLVLCCTFFDLFAIKMDVLFTFQIRTLKLK